ncbi:beta-N-acetylhexosaminidase [Fibrella forsythiae]|uniref:beta-N-acetylhexosaminidase n=1 Tax=Fibrella forsythiae TaxID=2817061 RepID=A0ABS3JGI7_9BACT|nr:family 20 glycosylhydrolase [Fibrella forsythiae]MBO0949116.1 family 20 glycosylhydrolase [Fibrella forsythiae]
MRLLLFTALLLLTSASYAQQPVHLIPEPVSVQTQAGHFALTKATTIAYSRPESATLAALLAQQLAGQTSFTLTSKAVLVAPANAIFLVLNSLPDARLGREGYKLSSGPKGITISANQSAGLFYGAQTLLQLLPVERTQPGSLKTATLLIPAVKIVDYPRFGWRGVMLDVSRSFFPKADVMRYIDELAQLKINTLHWHLTDDNGWRIEIKSLPRLTSVGAWRVPRDGHFGERPNPKPGEAATYGGFYTQEEVREIVRYAQARNITIVPEVDVPGHSMAILAAYPELSCSKDTSVRVNPGTQFAEWYGNGSFKMLIDNTLNPSDEAVYTFLDKVFGEIAALFPGQYIHAGGDECYHGYWAKDPGCQALMKREGMTKVEELQGYFMGRVEQIINAKGKKFMGWDEILEGGTVSPSATVMSWRGMKGGIEAAKNGHDVVMSPSTFAYLDYMQSDPTLEPRIYASLRLKTCYNFEPVPADVDSTRILGGQGNLWTEQAPTMGHVEYMSFPRAWALAEVFWTPRNRRDWAGFIPRMETQMQRAEQANINYARAAYDPIVTTVLADNKLTVMLDSEIPGSDIYYSIDDTMPGRYSPRYSQPLLIPEGNVTLRVVTYRNGKPSGRQLTLKRDELVKRAPK